MRRRTLGTAKRRAGPDAADAGFTLVELMVVVLIIGILVAIAIPIFNNAKSTAQVRACFANQRTVQGAVSMWLVDATQPVSVLAGNRGVIEPDHESAVPHPAAAVPLGSNPGGSKQPDVGRGSLLHRCERECQFVWFRHPGRTREHHGSLAVPVRLGHASGVRGLWACFARPPFS